MAAGGRSRAATAADAADAHADALPQPLRKARGAWFTPWELALPTARRALAPLLADREDRPLRIVDPAVGGGAFLRAAFAVQREAGVDAAAALAGLHGVDVDATAAALARRALVAGAGVSTDAPAARALPRQVRAGDGLRAFADGTFDCVLTNPPWETRQGDGVDAADNAELRAGFALQGRGKTYTYRLFVERALRLLRPGGRLGLIVPASLWFDRDAEPLRRALLDQCEWEWLYGFENRKRLFAIDGRYRFGVVVATKGGRTASLRVAFGRVDAADWMAATPPHARVGRDDLAALSPQSGAFVPIAEARDLALLARMQRAGEPLLGPRSGMRWRQGDFNMTADRGRFVRREDAERGGHARGRDGVWRRTGEPALLPLLQGAMVHDLHPAAGSHAHGEGRATTWATPDRPEDARPLYLVDAAAWRDARGERAPFRIVHRAIGNATNERTMLACLLPDLPTGNSLGVLTPADPRAPLRQLAALAAVLASLPFDGALRLRMSGANLNSFVLADCCVPRLDEAAERELAALAVRLCALLPQHAPLWRQARAEGFVGDGDAPARTAAERSDLQTRIDVMAAHAFGLDEDDVRWIVRGCGDGAEALAERAPHGFWRVERARAVEARRPLRWLRGIEGR
jgi:SAM-dependent methyltransferase